MPPPVPVTAPHVEPVAVVEPPGPVVVEPEPTAPRPRDPPPLKHRASRPVVAAAEAVEPAKVSVVSTVDGKASYAELFVDGLSQGETPAQLQLAPGVHRVRVTRPGFQTYEGTVKAVSGKAERLVIELKR